MTDLTTYFKTDGVDDVMAEDMNRLIASSDYATFRNVETLTADKDLTDNDCPIQYLTPSGANRNVILPDEATGNHKFIIMNPTGTSYSLVVKTYGSAATLATLSAGSMASFYSSGSEYMTNVPQVTLTNTVTLSNKRITPRVTAITSNFATPTINTDNCDFVDISGISTAITSMTTNLSGTPTNGQKLIVRLKDDGTGRAITWGASFASKGGTLPTTTVASKMTTVGLIYNTASSLWGCVAVAQEA